MTWDEHDHLPVEVYEPGMYFGEFEVYKNTNRLFSCMALTDLELLVLNKRDFKKIFFRSFPKLGTIFIQEMNFNFERLEYIMEMIYDAFYSEDSEGDINDKLRRVKGEKIMLSRLNSQKNSFSQGRPHQAFDGATPTTLCG